MAPNEVHGLALGQEIKTSAKSRCNEQTRLAAIVEQSIDALETTIGTNDPAVEHALSLLRSSFADFVKMSAQITRYANRLEAGVKLLHIVG